MAVLLERNAQLIGEPFVPRHCRIVLKSPLNFAVRSRSSRHHRYDDDDDDSNLRPRLQCVSGTKED